VYILQIFLIIAKVMGWISISWFFVFSPLWISVAIFGFVYWIGGKDKKKIK